jgi:hypothetical protein
MPIQDLFSTQTNQDKLRDEKAIVSAVIKYFETAPSKLKSRTKDPESSVIDAIYRYFATK